MAVKPGQRAAHTSSWRAVLQRGFDTGYRLSDLLAQKISAAIDPRARLLRRRRRALRWGLIFGAGCVFWVLVTTVLASETTPVWVLLITGLIAAGAAAPATLLLLRYRWLRSIPLLARRPGSSARRLPPPGSAARAAMSALGAAQRGLFSLLGVLDRGHLLPAGEIAELTAAANRSAAAMVATAAEVVSMERTMRFVADSGEYLVPSIKAFTAQLGAGVRQYNEMVTAAAQLLASANGGSSSPSNSQRYRDELSGATDRLMGWAQAFDELGRLPRV
jgi:hypothetical protein